MLSTRHPSPSPATAARRRPRVGIEFGRLWLLAGLNLAAAPAAPEAGDHVTKTEFEATTGPRPAAATPDAPGAAPGEGRGEPPDVTADRARPGRAALAMGLMLAAGTVWYWAYRGQNAVDWDDPDFEARVSGAAWRFDNNGLAMNFLAHPLSGSAFYAVSRAHHLSVGTSAVYAFLTSFVWEYLIEFREKVSINDVLVTPGAGIALGEFFHKLGLYVNSSPARPSAARRALGFVLGPTIAITRGIDGDRRLAEPPPDSLGYSASLYHEFSISTRYSSARLAGNAAVGVADVGLSGRLVHIPGYARAGRFERSLTDTNITELRLNTRWSAEGRGLDLFADTLLFGHYAQDLRPTSTGLTGTRAVIGSSIAYRFLDSDAVGVSERLGVLHLPGLAAEASFTSSGWHARVWARAHPDFAGVGSLAYPAWQSAYPDERPKAILLKQGYYYGWGGTARLNARIGWGPLELDAYAEAALYDSIEGLDRTKELVTVDVPARDVWRQAALSFRLKPVPWFSMSASTSSRGVLSKVDAERAETHIVERSLDATLHF